MGYKVISDRVLELLYVRINKLETEKDRLIQQNIELVQVLSRHFAPAVGPLAPNPPDYESRHIRPGTQVTTIDNDIDAVLRRLSYRHTNVANSRDTSFDY